jgi:hypothetical protein
MRIALVVCCGQKLGRAAPAGELYTSPLFRKAAAYARTFGGWYILSAKYGLVRPEAVIQPYDCTLLNMPAADRLAWGRRVAEQMAGEGIVGARFIALAGAKYTEPLVRAGVSLETPLKGLGIGRQLAWLTENGIVAAKLRRPRAPRPAASGRP